MAALSETDGKIGDELLDAAKRLSEGLSTMTFGAPVHTVYNPLDYAWPMVEAYTRRFGNSKKRVVLFGMNPGPWGMAQTGVPFGEVAAVRDFLGLDEPVGKPEREHPKRPIEGLACGRSEVSGRRVWGLIEERFGEPEAFFRDHFIANFCPLVFMAESARNVTPDKLPSAEREPLVEACRHHLRRVLGVLEPEYVIGVGVWAEQQANAVIAALPANGIKVGRILHPSPASPAANRGWAGQATRQLVELGVWDG
ncbi:MAG: uracil-DNA glycosylase family protein [Planctomycetota bacterium]